MNPLGLYIHVPFCVRKCPYCGFFSESVSGQLTREYIDAVLKELVLDASSPEYDTVYIGGGTPSVLPYTELELLCSGLDASRTSSFKTASIYSRVS